MMLERLLHPLLTSTLSEPSLWGKLPSFGDFVHQSAQAQDMDAWQSWFAHYPINDLSKYDIALQGKTATRHTSTGWLYLHMPQRDGIERTQPWCFALPQGALGAAPHIPIDHVIVGVFANSCDKVGRLHPIVIWQAVAPHLSDHLAGPKNWLYWLSHLLQVHTPPFSTPQEPNKTTPLSMVLAQMWDVARDSMSNAPFGLLRKPLPQMELAQLLEQSIPTGTSLVGAHSESAHGVKQLPWKLWQELQLKPKKKPSDQPAHGYFWQQAHNGEYINALKLELAPASAAAHTDGHAS